MCVRDFYLQDMSTTGKSTEGKLISGLGSLKLRDWGGEQETGAWKSLHVTAMERSEN